MRCVTAEADAAPGEGGRVSGAGSAHNQDQGPPQVVQPFDNTFLLSWSGSRVRPGQVSSQAGQKSPHHTEF